MRPEESFVSQPIRSLQTMLRVIAESDRSLPTVVPDGIYGPTTMGAVTAFQRKYGLPMTGVADQATWDRIAAVYEPALILVDKAEPIQIVMNPNQVFVQGESSPYLYLLQSMLIQLSIENDTIPAPDHTGVLDSSTGEALIAFQALAGLPETGELDKITWKHIVNQFSLSAHRNSAKTSHNFR
jgi:peptidoglycan hydrolase-like protein with peptidoglycan-binding domain